MPVAAQGAPPITKVVHEIPLTGLSSAPDHIHCHDRTVLMPRFFAGIVYLYHMRRITTESVVCVPVI